MTQRPFPVFFRSLAVAASVSALLVTAGCTTPPNAPTPPPPGPLAISCPASMNVPSPNGGPAEVIYAKPRVTGAILPFTNRCSPTIGANFGVGTSRVTCTVEDAGQRSASCSFDVTVVVPRIKVTSFLAFGDSITDGVDGICGPRSLTGDPLVRAFDDLQSIMANVNPPNVAYPAVLQSLLNTRYRLQTSTVVNEGKPGEAATGSATQGRLVTALNTHHPEVLLLQEGVNDLNGNRSFTAISNALRAMIREAKGRNLPVFLGTILPQRLNACREFSADRVVGMNVQIRSLSASEGVTLVDLYAAFEGNDSFLDPDGLHPSVAGYAKIAETFFNSIRTQLEVQP